MEKQIAMQMSNATAVGGGSANAGPTGGEMMEAILARVSDSGSALADAIASNPLIGVAVLCATGLVLSINGFGLRALLGGGARATDVVGGRPFDGFHGSLNESLRRLIGEVLGSGRPRLVRTMWNGTQFLTWMRGVASSGGVPGRGVVIAMSQPLPGDAREWVGAGGIEIVQTEVVRLGFLGVLSPPELRVLALLGQGLNVREVARSIHRAEKTVEFHRTSIHRKLRIVDRAELVHVAQRAGLTPEDADRPRV